MRGPVFVRIRFLRRWMDHNIGDTVEIRDWLAQRLVAQGIARIENA